MAAAVGARTLPYKANVGSLSVDTIFSIDRLLQGDVVLNIIGRHRAEYDGKSVHRCQYKTFSLKRHTYTWWYTDKYSIKIIRGPKRVH